MEPRPNTPVHSVEPTSLITRLHVPITIVASVALTQGTLITVPTLW